MDKIERRFTRADVEAFFMRHWGKNLEFITELQSIEVLTNVTQPMWIIRYTSTWKRFKSCVHNTLVIAQFEMYDGSPYLNLPDAAMLPEGCATPAEEDAAITGIEAEKVAAWQARQQRKVS